MGSSIPVKRGEREMNMFCQTFVKGLKRYFTSKRIILTLENRNPRIS